MTLLEQELERRRQALNTQLLSSSDLSGQQSDLASRTADYFNKTLSPAFSSYGINQNLMAPAVSQASRGLTNQANANFASRLRGEDVNRIQLQYNTAIRRAQEAGLNLDTSIAYARNVAQQEMRNKFAAEQDQADRESSLRKEQTATHYMMANADLQNKYQPENDYEGAMYRALFGLGASTAGGYFTNKLADERFNKQLVAARKAQGITGQQYPNPIGPEDNLLADRYGIGSNYVQPPLPQNYDYEMGPNSLYKHNREQRRLQF